jgi:hypothetical protein
VGAEAPGTLSQQLYRTGGQGFATIHHIVHI